MHRRAFAVALAGWTSLPLLAQDAPRPRIKISAAQLHDALSARFPVRLGVPGLAQVQVSAPGLLLLPARNKLGASLHAEASGSALGRVPPGVLDLVFALRYEAGDRSIRAHEPELLGIEWPGLDADAQQALQAMLPGMARELAAELVLHRFTPRELALPDTMGLEPAKVSVEDDGVRVEFREKQARVG